MENRVKEEEENKHEKLNSLFVLFYLFFVFFCAAAAAFKIPIRPIKFQWQHSGKTDPR